MKMELSSRIVAVYLLVCSQFRTNFTKDKIYGDIDGGGVSCNDRNGENKIYNDDSNDLIKSNKGVDCIGVGFRCFSIWIDILGGVFFISCLWWVLLTCWLHLYRWDTRGI